MRRMLALLAALVLTGCATTLPTREGAVDRVTPVVVAVEGGSVRGLARDIANNGVMMFGAIPYAAPPVGALRWKPPAPILPWGHAVRPADRLPPECAQVQVAADALFAPAVSERSEDCLYLNVWTAAYRGGERRPVIVWLHGGGFMQGSSAVPMYDGASLARRGVVFVSVNYRLGVLGFLAHPALSAESPHHASGNYGLLDQIAAVGWVRRNIARFGGDPDNVTVAGQSAGSMSLSLLSVSPLAKGLFHRGIGETGASMALLSSRPLAEAEAKGLAFARSLGASSLAELRAMNGDMLVAAAGVAPGTFEPIVDGWVLPASAEALYRAGQSNGVPLLLGSNANENQPDPAMNRDAFKGLAGGMFGDAAVDLLTLYPADDDVEARTAAGLLMTAAMAQYPMRLWAGLSRAPVYLYRFTKVPPVPVDHYREQRASPDLGVWHGAEIVYALDNLAVRNWPWTAADRRLSDLLANYWVNFARTGNPNGDGLPPWPMFAADRSKVMQLGVTVGPIDEPNEATFRVLERHYATRK
jgi:para-nitrobenzyl esterase